jgi:EAL and modified HD-GYP domain-containing signal transduction protein
LTLLRLLGLLMEDADTVELEKAFKLEPGLTVNLMRLTNSVGSGVTTQITSLRHAITVLGRRQLQRWLQLLLYTNPQGSTAAPFNPLLQMAATRGRLMELLADPIQPKNREFADHAFMVGIMSLMPALLEVAIEEILGQLPVAERVKEALLERTGPLGQLLLLAQSTEAADTDTGGRALAALPTVTAQQVSACLAQALAWANHLGQ